MRICKVLFSGMLCLLPVAAGQAQTPVQSSFAAATVKQTDPNETRGRLGMDPDQFIAINQSLKDLLQFAYGLDSGDRRVFGGPAWVDTTKFDIQAKMDGALTERLLKMPGQQAIAQVRTMVQQLLADRFQLKLHHEMRDLPVYQLLVAKSGSKLKPSDHEPKPEERGLTSTGGHIEGRKAKVNSLSEMLGFQIETGGRKVLDKTGLAGDYDFTLRWMREEPGAEIPADAQWPGLFTALQEQLGLRMELTKAPVDTLAIDHVEMPSQN